jgi:hypothetical protein
MRPRIEIAEVVSFRLTLPPAALDQVVDDLSSELSLLLEQEGTDLSVKQASGDCALRFTPVDEELVLTEVLVCNDDGGTFFWRVLARLMTEHEGDLEARLVWSAAERNVQGNHAAVAFRRGRPIPQPGAPSSPGNVLREAALAAGDPLGDLAEVQPSAAPDPAGEEEEVRRLLARAQSAWAEYQRLKSARGA